MKKILCFVLAMLMLMSVCLFSTSAVGNNVVAQKFFDYCLENVPPEMQPNDVDDIEISIAKEIDGVTFFSVHPWYSREYIDVYAKFGDINVYSYQSFYPYDLGIYALSGDKIYTLEEAYSDGLIEDVSVLKNGFSPWHTFYEDFVPQPGHKYESYIVQKLLKPNEWTQFFEYDELYEYTPAEDVTADEATPDYALIFFDEGIYVLPVGYIIGDYVFYDGMEGVYYSYGYRIFVPETGEILSLKNAYAMGIEGIDNVFTEAKIGRLMGDMDNDRRLSIKDVTYIQKALADIEGFELEDIYAAEFDETLPCDVADFNRDRDVNIKDATAIQKYLAGIVE